MAENSFADAFEDKPEPVAAPSPAPEPTPVEPIPAPAAVEPPKPVEAPKPEPGYVPIAAVLDEREKRKDLEKRIAAYEAAERQAPSVPTDPEQLAQYIEQQTQRALVNARFEDSEERATEKHGADAVTAAKEWGMQRAQQSPAFAAEYIKQKNPIDWAVRQHKREKLVSELGDDDASQKAFIERRARELGLIPPVSPPQSAPARAAPQPPPPPEPAPLPTRSLASATSAGGMQTPVIKTEQDVFKGAFS